MATLSDLQQKVLNRRLAQRAVDDVVTQLADQDVADFLSYLADHVSETNIGDLLSNPEAQRLFAQNIPHHTQARVVDQLQSWIDAPSKVMWRWDVNAYLAKEVPAEGAPAFDSAIKWAESRGLQPYLLHSSENAAVLAGRHARYHLTQTDEGTIRDLLSPNEPGFRPVDDAMRKAALQYLRWADRHARLQKRRGETWSQRLTEAPLQLLSHRLKEALRLVGDEHIRPVIPASDLVLQPDLSGATVLFKKNARAQNTESVTVPFAGYEHSPLRLDLDHPAELRVVLEWTLDALHETRSPLRPAFVELLSQPSWARLLDELESKVRVQEASEKSDERVVFRVDTVSMDPGPTEVEVSVAVQKLTKSGKWSKGATASPDKLFDHPAATREDLVALELLAVAERAGADRAAAFGEATLALVGHPRVYDAHTNLRLQVSSGRPTVALVPELGGHRISVRVSDFELEEFSGDSQIVVKEDETVLRVAEVSDKINAFIEALRLHDTLLPRAADDRTLRLLPRLQPDASLTIPTELRGEQTEPTDDLVVRLTPSEDGLELEVQARPLGTGASWPPGDGPRVAFAEVEGQRLHAHRDLSAERHRARALLDAVDLPLQYHQRIEGLDRSLDVLAALEAQEGVSLEWPEGKRAWSVGATGDLRVRVQRAGEWFGVSGEADVDGGTVPLAVLLQAVRKGNRYVRVGKGSFARIEDSLRQRIEDTSDALFLDKGEVRVGLGAVEAVDNLGIVEADDAWRAVVDRAKEAENWEPEVPSGLNAELRDYQEEGFQWLARLSSWGAGACLADEMGLGKTIQTLTLLLHRKDEGPALVVAPTSVGPGWFSEAGTFTPELEVRMYRGPNRSDMLEDLGPGVVLITSYDVLARDGEALSDIEFGTLVLDEAQAIKNARTRRAKAARTIDAKWRLALTGTPLENHLGEVWSIFQTVSPGLLGPWEHFRRHFALPIERDGDAEVRGKLASRLRPFLLRRTKREVASELPPRTEVVMPVELSDKERRLYEATRDEAVSALRSPERFAVLAALTRLRRLACHPRLVVPTWTGSSSKLDTFMELVSDLVEKKRRALVFSQFTTHLEVVREALDFRGIESLYLDGKTPAKNRAGLVNEWQEGDAPIFLISLKAGGVGLNLTAADTVIHLDPWWNPAVEDQASDRAHRIGQEKPVTILRLVAQDTIEEKVLLLHQQKRDLADALLEGGDAAASLDVNELVALMQS